MQRQTLIEKLRDKGLCGLCLGTAEVYTRGLGEVPEKNANTLLAWGSERAPECREFQNDWRYLISARNAIEG